jgi:hypothetical protein
MLARTRSLLSNAILTAITHLGPATFVAMPALPRTVTVLTLACFDVEFTSMSAVAALKAADFTKFAFPRCCAIVAPALLHLPLVHTDLFF